MGGRRHLVKGAVAGVAALFAVSAHAIYIDPAERDSGDRLAREVRNDPEAATLGLIGLGLGLGLVGMGFRARRLRG